MCWKDSKAIEMKSKQPDDSYNCRKINTIGPILNFVAISQLVMSKYNLLHDYW